MKPINISRERAIINTTTVTLTLMWIAVSFIYLLSFDYSPTIISYNHRVNNKSTPAFSKIHKKDVFQGSFVAQENYLGIVVMKFRREQFPIYSSVDFKLKERGSSEWLVENNYDTRQFYYLNEYPFGFPIIDNSKNKSYEYIISTPQESDTRGVAINEESPIVITKYKYPAYFLISNPLRAIVFLQKKFKYAIFFSSYRRIITLFSLPAVFYTLVISLWKLKVINQKNIITLMSYKPVKLIINHLHLLADKLGKIFIFILLSDILLLSATYDMVAVIVLLVWYIKTIKNHLDSTSSFFIALSCMLLMILLIASGADSASQKAATWIYYFLIFAAIQALAHNRKRKNEI